MKLGLSDLQMLTALWTTFQSYHKRLSSHIAGGWEHPALACPQEAKRRFWADNFDTLLVYASPDNTKFGRYLNAGLPSCEILHSRSVLLLCVTTIHRSHAAPGGSTEIGNTDVALHAWTDWKRKGCSSEEANTPCTRTRQLQRIWSTVRNQSN